MKIIDEIENYFNSAESFLFVEADERGSNGLDNSPLIYLLFSNLETFNVVGIYKKVSDFFQGGQTKFLIFVENQTPLRVSIVNKINGDAININNPQLRESINDFLGKTGQQDKIVLLMAFVSTEEFLFHQDAKKIPPIVIDGYSLVYS